jgi:hypothetical protein
VIDRTHETYNHRESSQSTTNRKESHIQEMIRFIDDKGSPLSVGASPTLQNFVTKEIMPDIRSDMLNVFSKGKEKYLIFRNDRLTQRSTLIYCSDVMILFFRV